MIPLTTVEALAAIKHHLNEAAKIADAVFNDKDIYNYGRAYEYLMAAELGHTMSTTRAGADGYDNGKEVEYKTAAFKGVAKTGKLKSHTFNYFGLSRQQTYTEQIEYVTTKILSSDAHYWGIKTPSGYGMHTIVKVDSATVLEALLKKLPTAWESRNKDPRINIGLGLNNVQYHVVKTIGPHLNLGVY
jgi:hypothetical protein